MNHEEIRQALGAGTRFAADMQQQNQQNYAAVNSGPSMGFNSNIEGVVHNALCFSYGPGQQPTTEQKALDAIGTAVERELRTRASAAEMYNKNATMFERALYAQQEHSRSVEQELASQRTMRLMAERALERAQEKLTAVLNLFVPEGHDYPAREDAAEYVAGVMLCGAPDIYARIALACVKYMDSRAEERGEDQRVDAAGG